MNREEIENRIEVCEVKANGYREVGNTKLADKYDNEKYKWEKLLSDLNLLNERKIAELLDYKKGYFNLEQENKELHNKIDKSIEVLDEILVYDDFSDITQGFGNVKEELKFYLSECKTWEDFRKKNEILKGSDVNE